MKKQEEKKHKILLKMLLRCAIFLCFLFLLEMIVSKRMNFCVNTGKIREVIIFNPFFIFDPDSDGLLDIYSSERDTKLSKVLEEIDPSISKAERNWVNIWSARECFRLAEDRVFYKMVALIAKSDKQLSKQIAQYVLNDLRNYDDKQEELFHQKFDLCWSTFILGNQEINLLAEAIMESSKEIPPELLVLIRELWTEPTPSHVLEILELVEGIKMGSKEAIERAILFVTKENDTEERTRWKDTLAWNFRSLKGKNFPVTKEDRLYLNKLIIEVPPKILIPLAETTIDWADKTSIPFLIEALRSLPSKDTFYLLKTLRKLTDQEEIGWGEFKENPDEFIKQTLEEINKKLSKN